MINYNAALPPLPLMGKTAIDISSWIQLLKIPDTTPLMWSLVDTDLMWNPVDTALMWQ